MMMMLLLMMMLMVVVVLYTHLVVGEYRQDADGLEVWVGWVLGKLLSVIKGLLNHVNLSFVALAWLRYIHP